MPRSFTLGCLRPVGRGGAGGSDSRYNTTNPLRAWRAARRAFVGHSDRMALASCATRYNAVAYAASRGRGGEGWRLDSGPPPPPSLPSHPGRHALSASTDGTAVAPASHVWLPWAPGCTYIVQRQARAQTHATGVLENALLTLRRRDIRDIRYE